MKIKLPLLILGLILALATFLRLYQLDTAPPGVWYDEAYNGLDAITAMESSDYKIFYPENYGREGLYINALAISFKIFGVNNFSLRFPGAIFGISTVLGFYLLLRKLKLTKTTALLGIFILTTSFYHINFSRIAFRAIMVPFLLTWSFYFFIKGFYIIKEHTASRTGFLKKTFDNALLNFFMAGALTGVGLHTYIAYRVVPLIFIIILFIFILIYKRFLVNYWKAILVFIIGAIITAGPILFYFQQNPAAFTGRTDAVSIFNAPDMTTLEAFTKSLSLHLQSFFFIGDSNQRHNHNSFPALPAVWSLFFIIGFFTSLKEILSALFKRFFSADKFTPTNLLLPALIGQTIFWIMLIPGVLSLEGIPHSLRIIGVIPAIFLLTVLPFDYLRRLYVHLKTSPFYTTKHWRWLIMQITFSLLIGTFVLTGIFQSYTYFKLWAQNQKTAESFQQDWYLLGQFIKDYSLAKENYLFFNDTIQINPQDRLNIPEKSLLFSAYPTITHYKAYTTEEITTILDTVDCSNAQFILQLNTPLLSLKKINNYCRNLKLQEELFVSSGKELKVWVLK